MTIGEFLEQACDVHIDYELADKLWDYGVALDDNITVKTKSGIVLIGEEG